MSDSIRILGLESSCDDTAAAVVEGIGCESKILSSVVVGQQDLHSAYGGVVPEIAARAHVEKLDICCKRALEQANSTLDCLDAIAVTAGPGLIGGLLAGVMFAKGLAAGTGIPLLAINHLAGHALTARMTHGLDFPYLSLLVSGGHCQFLIVASATEFIRLGSTIDDAPGEAFDKSARLLDLGQPGGPAIEAAARKGDPLRFEFPRPLINRNGCNMSFSGLKTSLARKVDRLGIGSGFAFEQDIADICAGFQRAVADILAAKSSCAIAEFRDRIGNYPSSFAVSGGVAANFEVRNSLESRCDAMGIEFIAPPLEFCTDNAAMVAWAGIEAMLSDSPGDAVVTARPRWPLDEKSPPISGFGKKGPKA
ncbi:MAG: tRNA (adenosine(37)-N6)-threonylcarbamoyltransferase complex transferase subunit TsaD [Albidovulum sp.]|nr:tRNA (adenosine(37)-N6)-threonylcarbamoyltransferase complex transferase subunit TsaD [Albidovulum sp.]